MKAKICPLFGAALRASADPETRSGKCIESDCAWWNGIRCSHLESSMELVCIAERLEVLNDRLSLIANTFGRV